MRIDLDQVRTALEQVHDAHVPVSLRRMGMLSDIEVRDDTLFIELCIPCMACPAMSLIAEQVRQRAMTIDGVSKVHVSTAVHLPWDRDMVDADAQDLMRANGIQI